MDWNKTCFILLCLITCFTHPVFCQGNAPQITVTTSDSKQLTSPANILAADVTFTCSHQSPSDAYSLTLSTRFNSSDAWKPEAGCLYAGTTRPMNISGSLSNAVIGGTAAIRCVPKELTVPIRMSRINVPANQFSCTYRDFNDPSSTGALSDAFVLRSITKPTIPQIILSPPMPEEGSSLTVTCSSVAKPPPKMQIKINLIVQTDSVVNTPSEINYDQAEGNGNLILSIPKVGKELSNKTVLCETVDHPYSDIVRNSTVLQVIYGPESPQTPGALQTFPVGSGRQLTLTCQMDANPQPSYKWIHQGKDISTGQTLVVPSSYYEKLSYPVNINFTCEGTNPSTSRSARRTYTVNFIKTENAQTGTTEKPAEFEGWKIAVIVIAIVIFFVIIVIVICCVRRNRNSSKKSKAAQARKQTDEHLDEQPVRYQNNSTTSLSRPADQRTTYNYHENPTLPMEHRYSLDSRPLEEYIDMKPRSRKAIALEDADRFDNLAPPNYGDAPPAYSATHSPYTRNDGYMTGSYDNSFASYGAPC